MYLFLATSCRLRPLLDQLGNGIQERWSNVLCFYAHINLLVQKFPSIVDMPVKQPLPSIDWTRSEVFLTWIALVSIWEMV